MNNIKHIIGREYFTRVKSKTFLLTTFLAPLAIIAFYAVLGFIMTRGSDAQKTIAIIDEAQVWDASISDKNNLSFNYDYSTTQEAIEAYKAETIEGVLYLPTIEIENEKYLAEFHSDKQLALDESEILKNMIRKKVRVEKIKELNIDVKQLDLIDTKVTINPKTVKEVDKKMTSLTTSISAGVGMVVGFLLFLIIIIYGSQVMRSVTEEKVNRIVEVLISTIKPYELMMGKVIGVGLVGLTQMLLWAILIIIFSTIGLSFIDLSETENMIQEASQTMPQGAELEKIKSSSDEIAEVLRELLELNWLKMILLYFFYFIVGYFTYASLFAAIGSAAGDDLQEAQQLTMIATLPMVISFYIGIAAIRAPESTLSIWASILPFSAPIVMPIRLPFDPPTWQILCSMIVSIISVLVLVWLAARIYRVGILMYGKKASFKELAKWITYKG